MKKIGIISDTHGTFDEPLKAFLAEVDEIWCAGDIGSPEVMAEVAAMGKPFYGVYGNIDDYTMRAQLPEWQAQRYHPQIEAVFPIYKQIKQTTYTVTAVLFLPCRQPVGHLGETSLWHKTAALDF